MKRAARTICSNHGARENSPSVACWLLVRDKTRPAGAKQAKNAVFRCAGRAYSRQGCGTVRVGGVLYRLGCWRGRVGRVLYRVWRWVRDKVLPAGGRGGASGTKFSLLVQNWLKWAFLGVLGEFCTGWAAGVGVLGDFCTGDAAEATRDECLSVRSLSLWSPRIRRGEISHAIPLNVFQNLNSDR